MFIGGRRVSTRSWYLPAANLPRIKTCLGFKHHSGSMFTNGPASKNYDELATDGWREGSLDFSNFNIHSNLENFVFLIWMSEFSEVGKGSRFECVKISKFAKFGREVF